MSPLSYPLPTLAAQITSAGISAPAFEDILNSEIATEKGIYGSDIVLTPDTQDGQRTAARCAAINDANQMAIAVYNSFFPGYAQGAGLSAIVQINGLQRNTPTNSTVPLLISGVVGTEIEDGQAIDVNNNLWNLPALVTIPESGAITVTATAAQAGAITADVGTINKLFTIIDGWQTVTNTSAATPGNPVELDATLRLRQAKSTALPSQGPLDAIMAVVSNLAGVGRSLGYENPTPTTNGNGLPPSAVSVVVEGGDVTAIAQAIQQKKAPGIPTYGTTSVTVSDQKGLPITIHFFELEAISIFAALTIQPLGGYVSSTGVAAVNALVAFLNGLGIGKEVYLNWCLAAASLFGVNDSNGNPLSATFAITSLTIGLSSGSLAASNIPIAFNAAAQSTAANVTLTVL